MTAAYLGLGSNQDAERAIRAGIQALRERFGGAIVSPLYRSAAVGFSGADFLNCAARIDTDLSPDELKRWLMDLEDAWGRDRSQPKFSDRILDIDILLHGNQCGDFDGLRLPREEILKYAHVLKPLTDLAPRLRHPLTGQTFAEHWAEFDGDRSLVQIDLPEPHLEAELMQANADHPNCDNSALLLVDVQGRLAGLMHESEAMIRQQGILIDACRLLELPIIWAEQRPDKLGPTVPELTERLDGLTPCAKDSFGCWDDAVLRQAIVDSGRRQILLCGIEAHVCVWQTAAALRREQFQVHLIADAVSSRSAFNRDLALRRMQSIGVHLSVVEMVLFELMGNSSHPRFRDISRLLK